MDIYSQLTEKIIKEQENIIGPIAVEQAKSVQGLTVDWQKHEISFSGNKKIVLEQLIEKYKALFGQASVEVCKEAAKSFLPNLKKEDLPTLLQY